MAVPPTVLITAAPRFLAVDDTTGTLFVSTRDNSTVALVDTATCNAHVTTGCASPPPVVKVGFLPYGIVADPATGRVFVGNIGDSTVTAFDGRTCNAHSVSGCTRTMRTFDTGGWPTNLTLDDRNGTLYVSDNVDAAASIIGTDRER
jgi:DNA-binding beta-propeller fold protein YncE